MFLSRKYFIESRHKFFKSWCSHVWLWVSRDSEEAQVPWGGAAARCAHELCVSWAAQARGILMVSVPEQLPAIHHQLLIAGLKIPHGKML